VKILIAALKAVKESPRIHGGKGHSQEDSDNLRRVVSGLIKRMSDRLRDREDRIAESHGFYATKSCGNDE
jgi:hypothetical protein